MNGGGHRLTPRASQQIDSARPITFFFDAKPVSAFAGDSIASALSANGRRIFSRSFKYHRPRGLLCCSGDCPNCMMEVNGTPNVRACSTQVQEGMQVKSQHAWPSLDHDWLHVIERFDRLLPIGFYYKTLYKPRFLWHVAEPIIRRLAGLGRVSAKQSEHEFHHTYEYVDVVVVGGGPAGMQAASVAAAGGCSVLLVDNEHRLGGHLSYENRKYGYDDSISGVQVASHFERTVAGQSNVRVLKNATAIGCYEGNLVPVLKGQTLVHVRAKAIVVATGRFQYPPVFPGNDIPGVMLSRAALRLMNLYSVRPGRQMLVFTANDEGYETALECLAGGIEVVGVVDCRTQSRSTLVDEVRAKTTVWQDANIVKAVGSSAVSAAEILVKQGESNKTLTVRCDTILLATGWQGNTSLLFQAGCQLSFDEKVGQSIPTSMPASVFAAGEVLGINKLSDIVKSGVAAGGAAVAQVRGRNSSWESDLRSTYAGVRDTSEHGHVSRCADVQKGCKSFVCLCEDVTEADLGQGIEEGFDEIETLKRYSTASMGPCQGRMCGRNTTEICGAATHRDFGAVGTSTVRPPIKPVPLGVLGGPEFHPVKLSSIHYKHEELHAEFLDMGIWKRPAVYSSVEQEYEAVRKHAGLIDLSSLGKLSVSGRNAPDLLDKVYTHWFSNLKPGRTRYGVMCDDNGIILDDGTVARLADDRYYVTTSTGNVDTVEQWLKWWMEGTGWCVHVVNLTSALAAVNLAGPAARTILARVTAIDLSPSSFPYMACRQGEVAGIPATLLRVGFVGETGWEIHFPAEYGDYMWDALQEAGASDGLQPFGVETQRVLRLEKKHLIVGHDTDALSNPFDSDMAWVVKLDKSDFIGRHALKNAQNNRSASRLVGFEAAAGSQPADGSAVSIAGKPAGRITSVRYSPAKHCFVGLAWVPSEIATAGTPFTFYTAGHQYDATIIEGAFYDPEGSRLK